MGGMDDGGGGGFGSMPSPGKADAFPLDMVVEVYGIIYIYNPPQADSLGIEQVDENTVVEGTALGEGRMDETIAAEPTGEPEPAVTPDPVVPQPSGDAPVDPAVPDDQTAPTVDPAVPADPAEAPPVVDPAAGAVLDRASGLTEIVALSVIRSDSGFIFAG